MMALAQEAHFYPAESSLQSNQWWPVIKLYCAWLHSTSCCWIQGSSTLSLTAVFAANRAGHKVGGKDGRREQNEVFVIVWSG